MSHLGAACPVQIAPDFLGRVAQVEESETHVHRLGPRDERLGGFPPAFVGSLTRPGQQVEHLTARLLRGVGRGGGLTGRRSGEQPEGRTGVWTGPSLSCQQGAPDGHAAEQGSRHDDHELLSRVVCCLAFRAGKQSASRSLGTRRERWTGAASPGAALDVAPLAPRCPPAASCGTTGDRVPGKPGRGERRTAAGGMRRVKYSRLREGSRPLADPEQKKTPTAASVRSVRAGSYHAARQASPDNRSHGPGRVPFGKSLPGRENPESQGANPE